MRYILLSVKLLKIISFMNLLTLDLGVKKLSQASKNRTSLETAVSQINFSNSYLEISQILNKNRKKYFESNRMQQEEISIINFSISEKKRKIKSLKNEITQIEEKIATTNADNKVLCSREYELMSKIIGTEKRLPEAKDERNKNLDLLKKKETDYLVVSEKLKSLKKIKENTVLPCTSPHTSGAFHCKFQNFEAWGNYSKKSKTHPKGNFFGNRGGN